MILVLLNSFLLSDKSYANWAYDFVVWNDYIYKVSEVYVQEIEKEIGEVTSYTRDDEYKRHRGNFSNVYEEGTKYYSIVGISTDKAIAIEESDGRYIKAYSEGKYEVRIVFDGFFDGQQGIIKILVFLILGILAVVLIYKVLKNYRGKG